MGSSINKVAIITGGSRGIGREISRVLAKDGFNVAICYTSNQAAADDTVQQLKTFGVGVIAIKCDVSQPKDVSSLFEQVKNTFGRIDTVVSNAGILKMGNIDTNNFELLSKTLEVNTIGTYLVMANAIKYIEPNGRIIALSSSVIAKATPGYGAYIASKSAVEGLIKVLANEVRGKKITVNAIAPGPIGTDLFLEGKPQNIIDNLAKMSPFERLGQPEDIAPVISFLASENSDWIHGQIIRVNGGFA